MGAVEALAVPAREERQSGRLAYHGEFAYEYEDGDHGTASWRSISADGACIQIGRYLRPGRRLRIDFHGLELNMRVVWCLPVHGGQRFVAGVQLLNGGPELALVTLMAIVQRLTTHRSSRQSFTLETSGLR